jgi:Ca-activated chloride channel family protein
MSPIRPLFPMLAVLTLAGCAAPGYGPGASYPYAVASPAATAQGPAEQALERTAAEHGMNTEAYARIYENPFMKVAEHPLSTFAVDVDTASYSNMRRFLKQGQLPPADAVRIEELINYFSYDYPQPTGDVPFSVTAEVGPCPWNKAHRLVHVGLQGRRIGKKQLPPRNLVFLLDVSGSMGAPNKLPLLKAAMRLLVNGLTERDRVAIVVYAGSSGLVLPPTQGHRKNRILAALARLEAGGSTNGGAGIRLAYGVAREHLRKDGINRVILATDGDFNVGTTSEGDLTRLIEKERESGIFLTVLGLGMGNLKDSTMEQLADKGNGNYAYLDSLSEARKVLVHEAGATLVTIAKDVKLQLEFNPTRVRAYRLIGYENRLLRAEDFNDDKKDAGEIGAGHSVTALYEVIPAGTKASLAPKVDPLRYQAARPLASAAQSGELLTLKLRYKAPDGQRSKLIRTEVLDTPAQTASESLRFSAAVACFGMLLRGSQHKGAASYDLARQLAEGARGVDPHGYRAEFIELVAKAKALTPRARQALAR